jgi:nucleotide-binding universal stress UspA family protein
VVGGGEFVVAQLLDIARSLLDASAAEVRQSDVYADTRDFRADLIVCGTHGRTGLSRVALGSTAEEIVRRSISPVLIVPPGVPNI